MKKLILSLATLLTISTAAFAGNQHDTTLVTGTYNASGLSGNSGNIIIAAGATVTINGSSLTLNDKYGIIVNSGAKLNFPDGYNSNTTFNVSSNSIVFATGSLTLTSHNSTVAGTLKTDGDFTIQGATIQLSGCGLIQTKNFHFSTDNPLSGTGLLYVTDTYDNQGGSGYSGHPLTQSSSISINNSTTLNVGSAVHTNNTAGPNCTVTPVKWTGISVAPDANDSTLIHAKWTTTMEQNVKGFTLQASTNGLIWDDVKTISSSVGGNSSTATVYSLDYTDPLVALVVTAGFGLMGSLLIIGLIAGFISKKHKALGIVSAVVLVFMMVSCTKHNDLATPKAKKYHYFRVVETDLDGTPTYSQVFMIK